MKTLLEEDLEYAEKKFNHPDLPMLAMASVLFPVACISLLLYALGIGDMGKGSIFALAVLALGLAIYVGRQVFDLPLFYFVLSYKGKYNTLAEQTSIRYDLAKHISRTIYIALYTWVLVAFADDLNMFVFFPLILSLFVVPFFYRIVANIDRGKQQEQAKKQPVRRVSSDGQVDLSALSFIHENLDNHATLSPPMKQRLQELQQLLDYVTLRLSLLDDVETAHILKRMGEEELPRLLKEYEGLEAELQQTYESKMMDYLQLLTRNLLVYKEEVNAKKMQQINKTFSLLDERYQRNQKPQ